MKWNKLAETLPPIIKEEIYTTPGFYESGKDVTIKEQTSKPVLFKSLAFKELCKKEWIGGDQEFSSEASHD